MELSRRQALGSFCMLAAATSAPQAIAAVAQKEARVRPLGIQLYMLKKPLAADFQGTLNQVATIGYREVEISNFFGKSGPEIGQALKLAGLVCPSVHASLDAYVPGMPALSDPMMIDTLHAIGATQAVVPIFPLEKLDLAALFRDPTQLGPMIWKIGLSMTSDDWKRFADRVNEAGRRLAKDGIKIGYHNHNMEFAKLADGSMPLEIFLGETDPALVKLELDVGWAATAGIDVAAFLERHATRINQLHLKDTSEKVGTGFKIASAELGKGIVDWSRLLAIVERSPIEHIYVEQEEPFERPEMEEAKQAFEFLNARPEFVQH